MVALEVPAGRAHQVLLGSPVAPGHLSRPRVIAVLWGLGSPPDLGSRRFPEDPVRRSLPFALAR